MFIVTSSKLEPAVKKSLTSKKPSIFLGGLCVDNSWREEIKEEFGDKLFLLDPYDTKWKAEDNIYDELAGLVNADHVIFYKGGKGTENSSGPPPGATHTGVSKKDGKKYYLDAQGNKLGPA